MLWIRLDVTVWDHAKTLSLALALQIPDVYAGAHMAALWTWALTSAPDGDLGRLDARVIAKAARWPGDAEAFVAAAVAVGYLDRLDDGRMALHGWRERYEQWAERHGDEPLGAGQRDAERRRRDRERKALHRSRANGRVGGDGADEGDAVGPRPVTANRTDDDLSRPVLAVVRPDSRTRPGTVPGRVPGTGVGHVPSRPGTGVARPDRTGPGPDATGRDTTGREPGAGIPPTPRGRGADAVEDRAPGVELPGHKNDGAPPFGPPRVASATDEDVRLWRAALDELRRGMSAANYETYLAGTWAVGRDGVGALVVGVENPLVRDTLEQRFRAHLIRALYEVMGERTGLVLLHVADRTVDDQAAAGMVEMQG